MITLTSQLAALHVAELHQQATRQRTLRQLRAAAASRAGRRARSDVSSSASLRTFPAAC